MNHLISKLKYFSIKLLSYSPLLRFTDDTTFGEITETITKLRFSLISFNTGQWIFHFLTTIKDNNTRTFNYFKILKLKEVQNLPDLNAIDTKYNNYEIYVNTLSDEDCVIHKDALQYKLSQIEARKNKAFNKYLAYIAIVALILPLYASFFNKLYDLKDYYTVIFTIILLYSSFNLLLFISSFIKIKNAPRVTFRSIRNSSAPAKALTLALYYDWLVSDEESTVQVTIIKNIEKYMLTIISISLLFLVTFNIVEYTKKSTVKNSVVEKSKDNHSEMLTLDTSSDPKQFLYINKDVFAKIENTLLKNNVTKVIIVYNKSKMNDNYQRILNLINTYSSKDTDIIKLESNKNNEVQIILLKGDNK
ncbi:hypothetical protein NST14_28345 [Bacillus sp. FSL W8-0519]|uniref:hypothetical protein n=1 Tax=Bacillus TaxID=1386 RepID=UPI0030F845D9